MKKRDRGFIVPLEGFGKILGYLAKEAAPLLLTLIIRGTLKVFKKPKDGNNGNS